MEEARRHWPLNERRANLMTDDGCHVRIERSVNVSSLAWPSPADLEGYARNYLDLRGMSWRMVREAIEFEEEVLSRFGWDTDSAQEHLADDDCFEIIYGLDIGVASAVLALSAAKCASVTSCNGGAGHGAAYPVVAFFTRQQRVPDLLDAAEEANCGLTNGDSGDYVVLYSGEVRGLVRFARALLDRRHSLARLRSAPRRRGIDGAGPQLSLPFDD